MADELNAVDDVKNEFEKPTVAIENQQENKSEGEHKDDKYETNDKLRQDS